MIRIAAISDLHGSLPKTVPDCDVLIISGDLCPDFVWDPDIARLRQLDWLRTTYAQWEQTTAKHVPMILGTFGNHDWVRGLPEECRSNFLIDEGVYVDGFRFWGTPWVPPIGGWNYMLDREHRREAFRLIPPSTDVIIAHGPPDGVLDRSHYGGAGCPEFLAACQRVKPRHVTFGHIHEASAIAGTQTAYLPPTYFHNVAQKFVQFELR